MKKRIFIIILAIAVVLLGTLGVFYQTVAQSKPVQIMFDDESLTKDNFNILEFCISDKSANAYGVYKRQEGNKTDLELYKFNKDGRKYDNPQEIEFPEDMKCLTADLSYDEKQVYMTIIKREPANENGQKICVAYTDTEDLNDLKADDIKFIDELNTTDDNRFFSIDKDGNILYETYGNNNRELKYAENKNGEYVIDSVKTWEGGDCLGAALSPDGQTMIVSLPYDGNIQSVCNMFTMKRVGETWSTPELLSVINDGIEDKRFPKISSDGKQILYLSQTSYPLTMSENVNLKKSIWKADLSKVLEKTAKANDDSNKKKNSETHKYDTAKFDLKLRDKGDMSEKKGVYYEIYVNAFADSDGDGFGDLNGVTEKLDYLKDLGIDGIWLMPINASPSYHGYDVIDYNAINSRYGTEEDFKNLLDEAHKRNIKVIMDFVINHTSNLHPWFTQAAVNKDSKYRNYYRWVSPDDSENMDLSDKTAMNPTVWTKDGDSYYYNAFYAGMPDLNYNNPDVRKEIKNSAKKWMDLGVDGFRFDAAMHIYADNEFKKQEDKKNDANIQWWNELARYLEGINPNVYLVGEIWHNDDVMPQYAQPMDSKFNFTFRNNMFNSLKKGTALCSDNMNLSEKLQDILNQYSEYDKNYIDAVFADNHDLDRTMSVVDNKEQGRLVADIYLTLPGNPFIYYGEEIGMMGNGDDEFKRMPFKWNEDKSLPETDWYHKMYGRQYFIGSTIPALETQMKDENSMYNHYKNLISLRKSNNALNDGSYESFKVDNDSVMAYKRESDDETVYVFHNLSPQPVILDVPEVSEGEIIFKSNDNDALVNGHVSLDKTSSIIIKIAE